jgi:hypothetical protein
MEPFRSSFFSEPNTGSEPSRDLGTEPFHSIPPRSRTEHILKKVAVVGSILGRGYVRQGQLLAEGITAPIHILYCLDRADP